MDGISFVIRARNEENNIDNALKSLLNLDITYEVVCILHLCNDKTRDIAESYLDKLPLTIYNYDLEISRAGYETLVTPESSNRSLTYYYNWCYAKAKYSWIFKFDADFILLDETRAFLQKLSFLNDICAYRLNAVFDNIKNGEYYLFKKSALTIGKYIFWEVPYIKGPKDENGPSFIHNSTLSNKKQYWLSDPWFLNDDSEESVIIKRKWEKLCEICGPEPNAQARASNPECDAIMKKVRDNKNELNKFGISFFN